MKIPEIIPKPLKVEIREAAPELKSVGKFKICPDLNCREIAAKLAVVIKPAADADKYIELRLDPKLQDLGEEGYRVTVNESGFELTALAMPGMFYATRTLLQLLPPEFEVGRIKKFALPQMEIEDLPRFAWRGFMLDSARHFQSVAMIKKLLDRMAGLKLNRLHWHFMDNEACRIQFEDFPELADNARNADSPGIYSSRDVRDIIDYAAERYITVYPELEAPGHSRAALSVYPELRCPVAEMEKPFREYCLANPASMIFLQRIIDRTVEIFKPRYLHIGGDEARDLCWRHCPHCQEQLAVLKLDSFNQLQKHFMQKIGEHAEKFVPECIEWFDHLELGIPEQRIVQAWHEGEAEAALAAGHRVICSEHEFVYFDYPQSADDPMQVDWMLMLSLETVYQFEPTPPGSVNPELALGGEACIWTEAIPEDKVFYKTFPRLFAFAETVWSSPANRNYAEFLPRAKKLCRRFDVLGLDYGKI